jgi:thiamine biosynthesis protein ThiS
LRVFINGESKEISGTPSLAELIDQLDLPAARIAIELNRDVVRRSEWSSTILQEDDRIEIVHFVGGGVGGDLPQEGTKSTNENSSSYSRS